MFRAYIEKQIDKILTERWEVRRSELPAGFHPLEQFYNGAKQVVTLPWGPSKRTVVLRTLGAGETGGIEKCVKLNEDKTSAVHHTEWINLASRITKSALVSPTYQEIEQALIEGTPALQEGKRAFDRLEAAYKALAAKNQCPIEKLAGFIGQEKWNDFCELSQRYGCLLPANFICAVVLFETGAGCTDAETVTEDALIEAYALAKHYGKAPSDFIDGVFVEGTHREIDAKAALAWEQKHPHTHTTGVTPKGARHGSR